MPCRLEFTGSRFLFAGKNYPGIPLLVDSGHQFVAPVCDYLRYLVTHDQLKTTSVKTYAEYLRHFWRFLEAGSLCYTEVCDLNLIAWLNKQEGEGVSELTRAARCDVVFDLYVWLEANGYVQQMVRIPGVNDHERFPPKITSARTKRASARRASRFGVVCAIRPRASKGHVQPTPTADDLTELYIASDKPTNAGLTDRNHLLIDWYAQVGLRRFEWAALTVEQIPDWAIIDTLRGANESYELPLKKTKGGRPRHVGVLPELLEKTREYIEGPRAVLIRRFRQSKSGHYRVPAEIFLSEKTGLTLGLKSITNLLTSWFKEGEVEGHGHRLRATYLTNLFEAEIVAEESRIAIHPGVKVMIDYELILIKVAERAGHADINSLRPYLTLARKRRARSGGSVDLVTLQQQIESRRQELALLEHRIRTRQAELKMMPENLKKRGQ